LKTIGLLVMAYGTPRSKEEIEPYYTHITGGRKPSPVLIEELAARYEMIGGISPLARITENQVKALEKALNKDNTEIQFKAYIGLKHISPFIEDTVKKMHDDGIEEAISIVLAPHYSTLSIASYNQRALETAESLGNLKLYTIDSWYDEPLFIDYWASQLKETTSILSELELEKTVVIFSAHSLPKRILQVNDPYPQQIEETAAIIAEKSAITNTNDKIAPVNYAIGWQSAGKSPEPWLEPDVKALTKELFNKDNYTVFIYAPIGFTSEHLEILYDNDIECKEITDQLGAKYLRLPMPNDKPEFIKALKAVIEKNLTEKAEI